MSEALLSRTSNRPTEGQGALHHFATIGGTALAAEAKGRPPEPERERYVQQHVIPTWTLMELLTTEHAARAFVPTCVLAESWLRQVDRPNNILIVPFLARGVSVREQPTFFAVVDGLRGKLSLPVEQVVQLAGVQRRTYYNWKNRGHAPELAARRLNRAQEWLDRLAHGAPHVDLRDEANPAEAETLGGLLAAEADDSALAARLSELVSPPPPATIRAHVVDTVVPEEEHDPDELLAPDQILAIAAAAPPAPRRRRAGTGEWTPRELTDTVADGS
jgi:hypothetical protein